MIPGGCGAIFVRVEENGAVMYPIALAGLVGYLEAKEVEGVCIHVNGDDLVKAQRQTIETRQPIFRHGN